jgi:hypothetical protein
MFWVEDARARWDAYTYFQRRPKRILDWFDAYMK